ncbi:hypothetical protein F5X99DRAFT_396847 [Biscogniauxia marginata]|nr:hypothetical protein F5X99DRAFT_396847 [Biscogniauxia marginata]
MANNLLVQFQDIGYKEYSSSEDIPFKLDAESINIGWADTTVMPIKPVPEMMTELNSKLIVKKIWAPAGQETNDGIKRAILREARCLHYAHHRHVIRFETVFFVSESKPYMGIVMDRAEEDIVSYLEAKRNRSEMSQMCGWFSCLANTVAYVHGLGITHRDIKPPNILVKHGKVLLADFGISKQGLVGTLPTTEPNMPRGRTRHYAAPEVEDGSTRGRSADIFSLGAVFLEILVAHSYPEERVQLNKAKVFERDYSYGKRLNEVQNWMDGLEKRKIGIDKPWQGMVLRLCREMMSKDRDERPNIEKVFKIIISEPLPDKLLAPCCVHMGEDDDPTDHKRLIEACRNGNEPEVNRLLEQKVKPNTIGAIHQASAHGFGNIILALLRHRTDVNLRDHCGQTALHGAAGYGHEAATRILLDNHAKADLKDDEGRTPLLYASGHGCSGIVRKLLAHGADITIQDQNGQMALHFAAKGRVQDQSNHEKVIQILLEHGADKKARDKKGRLPHEYAERKSYHERVRLLGNNAPNTVLGPDSLTELSSKTVGGLSQIIQPPRQYSDADIKEVSGQLKSLHPGWEKLAKIYIVLKIIMQPDYDITGVLNRFLEKNLTDYRLPFREDELVEVINSPGAPARFVREQSKVISDKYHFPKHGEHCDMRDECKGNLEDAEIPGQEDSGKVYRIRSRDTNQVENTSNPGYPNDPHPPEKALDEIPIEEHTSIAAIDWSSEQRLYIQGTDGGIRQLTRRQHDSFWEGGRTQDKIGIGKLCSPVAATAWQQTSGYGQPAIRVYFLDKDNYIQERAWDPVSGWNDGRLNSYRIKAAPSSELAVTSWGSGNIILCYQDDDSTIRILNGWALRSQWKRGTTLEHAALFSPLAVVNFEHLGRRGLSLLCKFKDESFKELCWDKVEDERRENSDYYIGGCEMQAAPEVSTSAIAVKQVDQGIFIYSSTAKGIHENRYRGGWLGWDSQVGNGAPMRSISTMQLVSRSIRVYSVKGASLEEVVGKDRDWIRTTIMSGVACRGAECPRRTESAEHPRPQDSTYSTLVPVRQPTGRELVSQLKQPPSEENQQSLVPPTSTTNRSTESSGLKLQDKQVGNTELKPQIRSPFKRFLSFFCLCL